MDWASVRALVDHWRAWSMRAARGGAGEVVCGFCWARDVERLFTGVVSYMVVVDDEK
jgi:hypothetical protein